MRARRKRRGKIMGNKIVLDHDKEVIAVGNDIL